MAGVAERAAARVVDVPAYSPGRPSPGPAAGKLSSNEAPLGPSPAVQAAISAALSRANRYPEPGRAADVAQVAAHPVEVDRGARDQVNARRGLVHGSAKVAGRPDASTSLRAGSRSLLVAAGVWETFADTHARTRILHA